MSGLYFGTDLFPGFELPVDDPCTDVITLFVMGLHFAGYQHTVVVLERLNDFTFHEILIDAEFSGDVTLSLVVILHFQGFHNDPKPTF